MAEAKSVYSCEYCDKIFHQKTNFTRHVEALHLGIKYPCMHCDYRASQKTNLDIHVESVHEKKYYQCSLCDYKIHSRFNLSRHMRRNHKSQRNSMRKYEVYNKAFKSETKLRLHASGKKKTENRISFQNKRPQHSKGLYVCKECKRGFSQRPNLNRHRRAVHLGLKHKCELCDYEATQISNLVAHKFRRHENKFYSCPACDFTSKTRGDLRRHRHEQHPQCTMKTRIKQSKEKRSPNDGSDMEVVEGREVIIEFTLEPDLHYCDLCLFQTEEENALTTHLAVSHYEQIFGS